jgi:hypothetical protein
MKWLHINSIQQLPKSATDQDLIPCTVKRKYNTCTAPVSSVTKPTTQNVMNAKSTAQHPSYFN